MCQVIDLYQIVKEIGVERLCSEKELGILTPFLIGIYLTFSYTSSMKPNDLHAIMPAV